MGNIAAHGFLVQGFIPQQFRLIHSWKKYVNRAKLTTKVCLHILSVTSVTRSETFFLEHLIYRIMQEVSITILSY